MNAVPVSYTSPTLPAGNPFINTVELPVLNAGVCGIGDGVHGAPSGCGDIISPNLTAPIPLIRTLVLHANDELIDGVSQCQAMGVPVGENAHGSPIIPSVHDTTLAPAPNAAGTDMIIS
jgi:hypothetical protein